MKNLLRFPHFVSKKTGALQAFLTESHLDEVKILRKEIEQHLSKLAIDWLIARFLELTIEAKQEFLRRVNDIL